jgi:dihydroorotase
MPFDLILRGGRVIDPSQKLDAVTDIAFAAGKVTMVGSALRADGGTDVHDVSGLIVTPGLIDLHTHVYWGGTSLGIDAEEFCRTSGVTTAVDTGSAGPGNFAGFRKHVIERSEVRILAFLHVSHAGIFGFSDRVMVGESEELRLMDPISAVEVAEANRDLIVGIKVRVGRHSSGVSGIVPLDIALEVAEQAGLPVMAHIDHPPPSYEEVVARLRPGDVLTHAFRPFPNTPSTAQGTVKKVVLEARERGVLFDIGHGKGSFAFKTARAMLANGFYPDTISSDISCALHQRSRFRPGDHAVEIPLHGHAASRCGGGLHNQRGDGVAASRARQPQTGMCRGRHRHFDQAGPLRLCRCCWRASGRRSQDRLRRRRHRRPLVAPEAGVAGRTKIRLTIEGT